MSTPDTLLVLDLDETLIYATESPLARPADFQVGRYAVYKRPHVNAFLTNCQAEFEVAVWTSASSEYAAEVVGGLFTAPLSFVWAADRCTLKFDLETGERFSIKNLKKLTARGYDLDRVIMVDDSPEKHPRNYGNLVRVHPWLGDENDDELALLQVYLPWLRRAHNIRMVEKRPWRSQVLNGKFTGEALLSDPGLPR